MNLQRLPAFLAAAIGMVGICVATVAHAQNSRFENAGLADLTKGYFIAIDQRHADVALSNHALIAQAQQAALDGEWRSARENIEVMVSRNAESQSLWLRLATAWRSSDPSAEQGAAAAYQAYRLATDREAALEALFVLGDAAYEIWLDRVREDAPGQDDWRAISQRVFAEIGQIVGEDAELETRLASLTSAEFSIVEEPGKRPDTRVLSRPGGAPPPFCATFTDELAYEPEAALERISATDGRGRRIENLRVEIEGRDLCVFGLGWGDEASVTFGQGIRSANGPSLRNARTFQAFITDAPGFVGFGASDYVLSASGAGDIEIKTMNVASLSLALYRVASHELLERLRYGGPHGALTAGQKVAFDKFSGEAIWRGERRLNAAANVDHSTLIDISRIVTTWENALRNPAARRVLPEAEEFYFDQSRPQSEGLVGASAYALVIEDGVMLDEDTGPFLSHTSGRILTKWFVYSNIGLTLANGEQQTMVVARDLTTGGPVPGGRVELIARNGRVLAEGETDAHGVARFERRLTRGAETNAFSAVAVYAGDDFVYLPADSGLIDLSDLDVAGRRQSGPIDLYMSPERGIYRPGDTISALLLARAPNGEAAPAIPPLELTVLSNSGIVAAKLQLGAEEAAGWLSGGRMAKIDLPETSPIGPARLIARVIGIAEPIAEKPIHIAHFRPERAAITFAPDWRASRQGNRIAVTGRASAEFLYGLARDDGAGSVSAPVKDTRVRASAEFEAMPSPHPGCYGDFAFGFEREVTPTVSTEISRALYTDDTGGIAIDATVEAPPASTRPVGMRVTLELLDEYGAIARKTRDALAPLARAAPWVGVRHVQRNAGAAPGVDFELVNLNGDLTRRRGVLVYQLFRERVRYAWTGDNTGWDYQPSVESVQVGDGVIVAPETDDAEAGCLSPIRFGYEPRRGQSLPLGGYRIEIQDASGEVVTTMRFRLGGTMADGAMKPDLFSVLVSAEEAAAGRQIEISASDVSFDDGAVTFAVARNGGIDQLISAQLVGGAATVNFDIPEDWAGDYVHVFGMAFSGDKGETLGPSRAFGLSAFRTIESDRSLALEITEAPEDMFPDDAARIAVAVDPDRIDGDAYAALVAVDRGVWQMTGHSVSDPYQHFHGRRGFGFDLRDLYGRIIKRPGERVLGGDGGDLLADFRATGFTAPKIVVQVAEPKKLIDGKAVFDLEPFDFNGLVELVAVAWTPSATGYASAEISVYGDLDLSVGVPGLMRVGDRIEAPVLLRNISRADLDSFTVLARADGLDLDGGKTLSTTQVTASEGNAARLVLDITAPIVLDEPASVEVLVVSSKDGSEMMRRRIDVQVRDFTTPRSSLLLLSKLAPGQKLTLNERAIREKIAGFPQGATASFQLSANTAERPPVALAAAAAEFSLSNARTIEAITARGVLDLMDDGRSGRAVPLLAALQTDDGGFVGSPVSTSSAVISPQPVSGELPTNDWIAGPLSRSLWRAALALDYLTLLKDRGDRVDSGLYDRSVGFVAASFNQRMSIVGRGDGRYANCKAELIYPALVLARIDALERRQFESMKDCAKKPLNNVEAGLLAAFLFAYGDAGAAQSVVSKYLVNASASSTGEELEDLLMILALLSENQAPGAAINAMTQKISASAEFASPMTLGAAAWRARAERSLDNLFGRASEVSLNVNGRYITESGPGWVGDAYAFRDRVDPIVVENTGPAALDLYLSVRAPTPVAVGPEGGAIALSYRMFDREGRELNVDASAAIARDDLVIFLVEGYVNVAEGELIRVAAALPTGFEVEIGRVDDALLTKLLGAAVTPRGEVKFHESQPDRQLAVVEPLVENGKGRFTYAFAAHSTVSGLLTAPGAVAEMISDPGRNGASASSALTISAAR